jgi:hypothetical protein
MQQICYELRAVRRPFDRSSRPAAGEYQDLPFGTIVQSRFLKSRVYAKLLRGLISICYQTFIGHSSAFQLMVLNTSDYEIGK